MKKIFVYVFFSIMNNFSFSQSLPEFTPIGAKWHYQVLDFNRSYTIEINSLKKDTILGIECKQLTGYPGDPNIFYSYRDSLKIYFYHSGFGGWKLLYDFTKNVGESYFTYASNGLSIDSMKVSILSKGDTLINGYLFPYVIMDVDLSSNYIFKGKAILNIGAETYFIPYPLWFDPTIEGLSCYEDNIIGSYQIVTPCDTVIYLSTENYNTDDKRINSYPNPANENISFSFDNSAQCGLLIISDVYGRVLKKIIIRKEQTTYQIDIRNYSSGIYMYQFISTTEILSGKFVKK